MGQLVGVDKSRIPTTAPRLILIRCHSFEVIFKPTPPLRSPEQMNRGNTMASTIGGNIGWIVCNKAACGGDRTVRKGVKWAPLIGYAYRGVL